MRFVFLVNDVAHVEAKQTTAMLIAEASRQGYEVLVCGVTDLSCSHKGEPEAYARKLSMRTYPSLETLVQEIAIAKGTRVQLTDADVLMIRTNPARDQNRQWAHSLAMRLALWCKERGLLVINDPIGLTRASSKLYLLEIPASARPKTLISQQHQEIIPFIESLAGPAVLKPLEGTRGNDVFFVSSAQDKNLNQIIDVILRQSAVMIQEFIPEADKGDTRVVVFNGKILEVDGKTAAIKRVPGKGELRSNIHAGGNAQPGIITDAIKDVVDLIGPKLVQDGLLLVGLDFIGGKIIEINVFSTGGFRDAERFERVPFTEKVIREVIVLHRTRTKLTQRS